MLEKRMYMMNKNYLKYVFITIVLVLFIFGCEKNKESNYVKVNTPKLEKDFRNFIEYRRLPLKSALANNSIMTDSSPKEESKQGSDWLKYKVHSLKNLKTGIISSLAWVTISGTTKLCLYINGTAKEFDQDLPETLSFNFTYREKKWLLILKNGYIEDTLCDEGEDKTCGYPPELHSTLKSIFPYHFSSK